MIDVKLLKYSCSNEAIHLYTFEVEIPRVILAEWNTHGMLCLAGDTELWFDLPTTTPSSTNFNLYKMTIKEFVSKWINGAKKRKRHSYTVSLEDRNYTAKEISLLISKNVSDIRSRCRDKTIKVQNPNKKRSEDFIINGLDYNTYHNSYENFGHNIQKRLSAMRIRNLNEESNLIQHASVKNCWISGKKELFKMTLQSGKFIRCSKDHRILTKEGWKTLENITLEDYVIVQEFGTFDEDKSKSYYKKKLDGKWISTYLNSIRQDVINVQKGICSICNVTPMSELHHKVPVHIDQSLAFERSNIIGVCATCHKEEHSLHNWNVSQYLHAKEDKVVSISPDGIEETYDLEIEGEFPNFIANGIVVHNSSNAQSSRAVPVAKLIEQVQKNPYYPPIWGKNQRGMQAYERNDELVWGMPVDAFWQDCINDACNKAHALDQAKYHKQIANRVIEPYSHTKLVISGTEWDNFFNLRIHHAAEPNIREMAIRIYQAMRIASPQSLNPGEWHLPYIDTCRNENGKIEYSFKGKKLTTEQAIRVSLACIAKVSYRSLDPSPEAVDKIINTLFPNDGSPIHASPSQHIATPFQYPYNADEWQVGESHRDKEGWSWSAQLRGWCQYRKTIPNENCEFFTHEVFLERMKTF